MFSTAIRLLGGWLLTRVWHFFKPKSIMTKQELKAKHNLVEWHSTFEATEKHTQISIEFAICVLQNVYDLTSSRNTYKYVDAKINELKQNLKK
jgi:hypothetical protein